MKIETITHEYSGEQLPILLDNDGLPITSPNEFIFGRRALATNTLVRNLRELSILYNWLDREKLDPVQRISLGKSFSEAEIRGSLIEFLRRQSPNTKSIRKLAVSPITFNQRLTTIRQFFGWLFDVYLGAMSNSDNRYERILENKKRMMNWFDSSFINSPPKTSNYKKGLTQEQAKFLVSVTNPNNPKIFGRDQAVRYRNYISIMIMLNYGLRPGELLTLRVQDIEFGSISAIRVIRRGPNIKDIRQPRPQIKRNGRVLPIDNKFFSKQLDAYIMEWREKLEERSKISSDYLIISDEGMPLSLPSITQLFQHLRFKFPNDLPINLSAKSLRHTFSSNIERELRAVGIDEEKRKEVLAELRGDSSLESQSIYIAQEVQELANLAMRSYQMKILS